MVHPGTQSDGSSPENTIGPSVVFCITELDPGGAEHAMARFATGLHQMGWPVKVVSLRDQGAIGDMVRESGVPVESLNCGTLLDVRAIWRLRRVLNRVSADVLICFLHQANVVGRLAAWRTGVRCVVSGIRVADRRRTVILPDRLTRCLTDHYVAVSHHVARTHSQLCFIPSDRMTVICNGVDLPETPPSFSDSAAADGPFRVLFVGRLTDQKRPQDLIDAVQQLPDSLRKNVTVDILGDGPLKQRLQDTIKAAGLARAMHVHGFRSDAREWMRRSDVLVLPSAWEGLPNVVLEAMACGLPVISSAVDGVPEAIEDGVTGWLFPPGDCQELARCLQEAAQNPQQRQQIARAAYDRVRHQFCWDRSIGQLADLIRSLLSRSGCR